MLAFRFIPTSNPKSGCFIHCSKPAICWPATGDSAHFVHLAMLHARGVHACFRCHQAQIVDFHPHRKSRDSSTRKNRSGLPTSEFVRAAGKANDQIVRWKRPTADAQMDDPGTVVGDARMVGYT